MFRRLNYLVFFFPLFLWSCKTTDTIGPVAQVWKINTSPVAQVGGYKASAGGFVVTRAKDDPMVRQGVCWTRVRQIPTINMPADYVTNEGSGKDVWNSIIERLNPSDTIWVRSYLLTKKAVFYGDTIRYIVQLEPTEPVVVTDSVPDPRKTSAKLTGRISTDGGSPIFERGFELVNTATMEKLPPITVPITNPDSVTTYFSVFARGLSTNVTYEVRAYAKSQKFREKNYGGKFYFFTDYRKPDPFPIVDTKDSIIIFNSTDTAAFVNGFIVSKGDFPVSSKGVCFGTAPAPDISGMKVESMVTTSAFKVKLDGLKPRVLYFYRAFARNAAGVSYGEEKMLYIGN